MTPSRFRSAALAAALIAAWSACAAPHATSPTNAPTPSVASPQVVTEPDDGMAALYRLMASATTSVDLWMYELVDTRAESIFAAGAARGVRERVVLDRNREGTTNTAAYTYLAAHGVEVHGAPAGFAASHQKVLIVDGQQRRS